MINNESWAKATVKEIGVIRDVQGRGVSRSLGEKWAPNPGGVI